MLWRNRLCNQFILHCGMHAGTTFCIHILSGQRHQPRSKSKPIRLLVDVISGLRIHDQIKTNQTIWFEQHWINAFLIMLMMIVMMMRMMQATSSQANQTWHPTMWWRNQPHNTFILHCELRARTTLCICMLQQTHPLQMAFLYFVS